MSICQLALFARIQAGTPKGLMYVCALACCRHLSASGCAYLTHLPSTYGRLLVNDFIPVLHHVRVD